MDNELLASVVVAVNGDMRVFRLLASLLTQTIPSNQYEVIVVENGSKQLTDVISLNDTMIRYIYTPTPNLPAARNLGLGAARGKYMLTTDADAVVRPDWIEHLVRVLDQPGVGAAGGQVHKLNPVTITQRYGITIVDGQMRLNYLPALDLPYVVGVNAGYSTSALRAVGGFDNRLFSGCDVDICYKLSLNGHRVCLAPEAIIFHEDRDSFRGHFCRFRHYAIYQVLLFAIYRKISMRHFVINPYPIRRIFEALAATPLAIYRLVRHRDSGPICSAALKVVEALGVWCGDIEGSMKFRQFYI